MRRYPGLRLEASGALIIASLGCSAGDDHRAVRRSSTAAPRPDEFPSLVSRELPFKYPAALYALRRQGNVTLRLYIDRDGRVVAESTRIEEPSGYVAFDSAAVAGASALRFVPAKRHGEPIPITVFFPVQFRHPDAPQLPGDSVSTPEIRPDLGA